MKNYIALIHHDADGDEYRVSYPDFPDLASAGHDLDEARALAEETLLFHADGLMDAGKELPEASTLESVMGTPTNRTGVAILIAIAISRPKFVRVNITMREDVLSEVDAFAEAHGMSRSVFLSRAAKREIGRV